MKVKAEVRLEFTKKRMNFSEKEILEMSEQIINQIKESSIINHSYFHIFLPIIEKNEVNTFPLIDFLLYNKKKIAIPKIEDNEIESYEFDFQTVLEKNKWNILEPKYSNKTNNKDLEVVFIPLIICDFKGNRIGYGKGFYDKFLAKCSKSILKIGLNFFEPILEEIINEKHDITLDYLVTPSRIVSFLPKFEK